MWMIVTGVTGAVTIFTLIRLLVRGRGRERHLGFVSQQWVAEHRLSHQSEGPQR